MYTQISLKQILNTLSKCDQKQVTEGNFDNIYVTLEDIIGTLREDEKTDFVKENAKKLYDIIDCYTNIVDNDFKTAKADILTSIFEDVMVLIVNVNIVFIIFEDNSSGYEDL